MAAAPVLAHARHPSAASGTSSDGDDDDFQDAISSVALSDVTIAPGISVNDDVDDDDAPPAFPALNSAQRSTAASSSSSSSSSRPNLSAASSLAPKPSYSVSGPARSMPPPAKPASASSSSSSSSSSSKASGLRDVLGIKPTSAGGLAPPSNGLAPPPVKGSSGGTLLAAPPRTTAATAPPGVGGASGAGGLRVGASTVGGGGGLGVPTETGGGIRKKVVLAPGCSALDWARLKSSSDLRGGVTSLLRVTPSELKKHNSRQDAWSAFNGKVYNITPYLRFHPGGADDLMRVAGRDGTRLFMLTHSWVNIDAMIDACMVGMLVPEHS